MFWRHAPFHCWTVDPCNAAPKSSDVHTVSFGTFIANRVRRDGSHGNAANLKSVRCKYNNLRGRNDPLLQQNSILNEMFVCPQIRKQSKD